MVANRGFPSEFCKDPHELYSFLYELYRFPDKFNRLYKFPFRLSESAYKLSEFP